MAQVAIITASDSGIGKECALLLAQQGFDIGITWHSDEEGAKDTAREVVSHGVRAEIVQLDLGKLPEGAQALELVRHKILVNAVAPGAIATPMNGMDDSDVKPDAEPSIPLRRFGATHEIASLVAWLCSEGANYTTGQSLIVDGGFMLANPQFNPE
ncbi:TPA: SDR family oxidoreductase [Escherichia coli]|nr:SDR family oxidoreductase [Escherichia coli]